MIDFHLELFLFSRQVGGSYVGVLTLNWTNISRLRTYIFAQNQFINYTVTPRAIALKPTASYE